MISMTMIFVSMVFVSMVSMVIVDMVFMVIMDMVFMVIMDMVFMVIMEIVSMAIALSMQATHFSVFWLLDSATELLPVPFFLVLISLGH